LACPEAKGFNQHFLKEALIKSEIAKAAARICTPSIFCCESVSSNAGEPKLASLKHWLAHQPSSLMASTAKNEWEQLHAAAFITEHMT